MRRSAALFLVGALAGLPSAMAADNGIFVAEPKLYDDYTLEKMLLEAEDSLAKVELLKADAISSALGGTQGVEITQTQLNLTATQRPTARVVDTQSATPSVATTTEPVTPTVPTLPPLPALSPPSTINPSAIDKLDEFLQLKLRVSNLRLLLRGSLTDQVSLIQDDVVPQSRFTFGFPVTLTPPAGWLYRDAIAEVEVRVTLDEKCAPSPPPVPGVAPSPGPKPGLKMVLPQEKTYNVAQLRSSTTSIGTGVVAGAFSVGGNWLRGQSKLFLVQDQDTLAYEGHSDNDRQIVFGWRFKPVLGQRKVQPSLQQVFAQLTFPIPPGAVILGKAEVTTRWRRYERKTGALGEPIPDTKSQQKFDLKRIDLAPGPITMELLDLGSGKVRVTLAPEAKFFEGTTFRLGGSSSPIEVARPTDHVLLDLAPLDIVRQGVLVGVRGEEERLLVNPCVDPGRAAALPAGCEPTPSVKRAAVRSTNNCPNPYSGFKILQPVTTTPISQSTSLVKVILDKLQQPNSQGDLRFLTILGDKVFGLKDAPYETYTPCLPAPGSPCTGVIEFLADNATLEKAGSIEVVRLFWGTDYHASKELDRARRLVVSKSTIVSTGGSLRLALEGQGFNQASIKFPANATFEDRGPGHALVLIPGATADLKNLVLQVGGDVPVLVDIANPTPAPAPPAKPVLNPPDPVKIGTGVDVTISWKNEGEIKSVTYKTRIQTVTPLTKNSATIRLEDALTARPGKVELSVAFKDGTELPLTVQVVDQKIAVIQQ